MTQRHPISTPLSPSFSLRFAISSRVALAISVRLSLAGVSAPPAVPFWTSSALTMATVASTRA
ncbi:hypothetical protein CNY89_01370 [Amaricoccus sp. HAR-UPW-R2A-40]|nr:hypothetical protein CNY89_01370 [Amaricoccus sp. HAR-UPW-R2A-40]